MAKPGNAPTNGNHGRNERTSTIKQRSVLLGQKRVPKTGAKGGDDAKARNKGRLK